MNAISTLLLMVPFLLPILLANLAERNKESSLRLVTWIYLGLMNGVLLLGALGSLGMAVVVGSDQFASAIRESNPGLDLTQLRTARFDLAGVILLIGSVLAVVLLLPPVRRAVARITHIDPHNVVHTTALSMTSTAFALNLFQVAALSPLVFAALGNQEVAQQLRQTYLDVLVFPFLTFVLAALLGVGLYVRRNQAQVLERLGLTLPTPRQLGIVVVMVAGLIALAFVTEQVWQAADPKSLEQVGGLSEALLGNLTGVGGAFAIGLSAALGEEIFFRGAMQPRLGLVPAALLFTSFHVQYAITPATLLVLVIGLVLGVLRQRTSLTVCILVHFFYNFISVLLG